ncbi:zinc-binding alcohol dehydrogenase family protein [Shewanella intestini]|uniref:Zinc-type alcohol dehydrogenase-like protein n=1 Tax=Shewanella intestini TaxID=2017544 RepID=A0ABS5I0F9_9GAMM|nr:MULTISPECIES: zinc-binding alcohol dehydrogenase family protein [Shewanella]MBR9727515.1 zinc-binding alcohol dehydrogenase family protein [Shewanella intestini]MRG35335.1 zinc-binding alcohol dehydrogenase family protein [Shewanella sp. XMDDZSB0408]
MKAIGYYTAGAISAEKALEDITLATPTPSGHDLLIEIKAIAVNPADAKVRQRRQPPAGEAVVLGWDAVGVVKAVGDKTELFSVGDEVWYAGDVTRSGTYAQYQLVDERIVGHKPTSLSHAQAAAMPLTSITAWEMLFDRLGLPQDGSAKDARILVIGAAGGVGSILVQLAAKLTGATVIGTASREKSRQWVLSLGADAVIDHSKPLHQELINAGFNDVTHVVSLTHTDTHFDEIISALRPQGKIALIDDPEQPIDIMKMKAKSLSLHWEFMFTRSMFTTDDIIKQHQLLNQVATLIDNGTLTCTMGEHFGTINATNLIKAHQQLETNSSIGKIVLEGFE